MENKYEKILQGEWEKFQEENVRMYPNIMLLGKTGCGKSSFINLVFGRYLAPVNDVERGTMGFHTYRGKDHGMCVNLIDSRGYEMEDEKGESFFAYHEAVREKMEESGKRKPLEKIHIIWYCISVAGEKIEDYDIKILQLLKRDHELKERVAVLLTKCDEDDEDGGTAKIFKQVISEEVGDLPVFEVSTDTDLKLDLEELMEWSGNQLDEEDLQRAFFAAQMISLKAKKKAADGKIAFYAAAAGSIGAAPIPMADAALLTPLQLAMAVDIIHCYRMEQFTNIAEAAIGSVVLPNLGKAAAGGLLKLIPGIGTLIGGAINAGVASLITSTLGLAVSGICYDSCKKLAKGETVDLPGIFSAENLQKYTKIYMEGSKKDRKNADGPFHSDKKVDAYARSYIAKYRK